MNRNRRVGFTLMEIMVVIIVIAVLASVAGPMIGSITDQGRTSATRANMNNIKTALVSFNNDLGRFPFQGTTAAHAVDPVRYSLLLDDGFLGNSEASNVLVNNEVPLAAFGNLGHGAVVYGRRWRGPYMDTAPVVFMHDAWQSRIQYFHGNVGAPGARQIFLQSAGADGVMNLPGAAAGRAGHPGANDAAADATQSGYAGDDILISVTRTRFP